MKKLVSMMLAVSMCASMCVPALANEGIHMTYENGKLKIYSSEFTTATLIHASYDEDRMLGLKMYEDISFMGETAYTIDADEYDKFMLWDSIENMMPLCDDFIVAAVVPTESPTMIPTVQWWSTE